MKKNKVWFLALSKSFVSNIQDAKRFGKIEEILPSSALLTLTEGEIAGRLEDFAYTEWDKEDYIVLVGPARYVFMLGAALGANNFPRIKSLDWDKETKKYERGELILWQ